MALYHAWIPNEDGTAPVGSSRQTIINLQSDRGAIRRAVAWWTAGGFTQSLRLDAYADSPAFYANRSRRVL